MTQFIDKFKQLDAYAKTLEDFRVKTTTGATVTIIGGCIMILLFMSELHTYLSPNISEELFVDTSRGHKLRINLDIIVPTISCNYLVLDAMDSSGEQHLQMEQNIHKRRLDLDGNAIEEPKKEEISTASTLKQNNSEIATLTCGSCYGAAFNESQCCNTCDDVKEAYRLRRWALPHLSTIEQCKNDESVEKLNLALKEGCQIYGYMEVNRVGGSFHIAPGKSFTISHVHVHDVQPFSSSVFNTTHIIKHLSFGTDIEGANTAPLNGIIGLATEGAMMFQYYLKIIPTMYVKLDKTVLHTNQFSVTRHHKSVSNVHAESGMPGAFFSYELSPLMVKYTEKERSIGHFATNICAIIGGVFTVAGIFDALLYHSINAFENKLLLGKTG
ncbi:endoplasmic reticulum-Golgi intermediate compartment protein 3 [Bombyx mandarina]|uniref:Endoplasmic reticulum-Golgi intermediate compartment protein 3 n=2 Tax=Bombyx TaxID=7090 RepID=A0A8R2AP00_BOMMO|nr:endoplasmic reticulum-Golgi intermediate compartment protein 3 [Bombyx mori]XP_028040854.1 endoplasmic reticulum-Golgi intermediate compartment protein 3 [Bombyx mandarina]